MGRRTPRAFVPLCSTAGRRPLQNDRGTGQDAVPYTRFNIPSCRAGPVCPAAGYAFFGGTHGSRPTGYSAFTGRAESSAPTKSVIARSAATRQSVLPSPMRRIPTPVTRSLARNDGGGVRAAGGRGDGTHGSRPTGCSVFTGGSPQPLAGTQKRAARRQLFLIWL